MIGSKKIRKYSHYYLFLCVTAFLLATYYRKGAEKMAALTSYPIASVSEVLAVSDRGWRYLYAIVA